MRIPGAALVVVAALTACTNASGGSSVSPAPTGIRPAAFDIQPITLPSTLAPLQEVRAGHIRAIIPHRWQARPLSEGRYPQEGFVASPRIADWEQGVPTVQGMEAFWIDGAKLRISSDYYYLAARAPTMGSLVGDAACVPLKYEVIVDHPPDVTGSAFSPSDFVVRASGECRAGKRSTRWEYVIVAPGFGPVRQVGIPNSGLYVVVAVVSGHRMELLDEMIDGATFGDTRISDIVTVAGSGRLQ